LVPHRQKQLVHVNKPQFLVSRPLVLLQRMKLA
jgi:hypothetical protein